MKGEYVQHQQPHQHKNNEEAMFSKQLNPFPHHFHLSHYKSKPNDPHGTDGPTIEAIRRPKGRPPGYKNKPKPAPPLILTPNPEEPTMTPFLLEVSGGNDVVNALSRFARRRNNLGGLCVLTGSGTVSNVTLRQLSSTTTTTTPRGDTTTITFHGRFDILSINATFLPQTTSHHHPSLNIFTISLAGPQGQIVGGAVAGGLMAEGPVFLIAASFNNPSYHRLPPEEEEAGNSVSGGGDGRDGNSTPVTGGRGECGTPRDQSCGMNLNYLYEHF